ncbi:hypothetical protein WMY93_023342 [Mugilogobius chulae]|uniref:Uncharacterized protein n=1 Tax=Mugilogobius chulae TaxID=88201 RepID=A0AAW0NAW8_9GOBI
MEGCNKPKVSLSSPPVSTFSSSSSAPVIETDDRRTSGFLSHCGVFLFSPHVVLSVTVASFYANFNLDALLRTAPSPPPPLLLLQQLHTVPTPTGHLHSSFRSAPCVRLSPGEDHAQTGEAAQSSRRAPRGHIGFELKDQSHGCHHERRPSLILQPNTGHPRAPWTPHNWHQICVTLPLINPNTLSIQDSLFEAGLHTDLLYQHKLQIV